MKKIKITVLSTAVLLLSVSVLSAQTGSTDIKVGYIYLDEEGNSSVSHSSFNYYDGPRISVENFKYRFKNGLSIRSDLKDINLENRNLTFELGKAGRFGVNVNTSRFRRVYDFSGESKTKRDLTSAGIWVNPSRYLKVFGSGSFNSVSGEIKDLIDPGVNAFTRNIDYSSNNYGAGARLKYEGRMFQADYNTISYKDDNDEANDQSRMRIRLFGYMPVPNYEWLVLSGSFQRFKTEFDNSDAELQSTTARGGILANLPNNVKLNYIAFINRAGSDRDLVKTDNVAHLIYAGYARPGKFRITAGYQMDVNDDFEDEVKGNAYYLSGSFKPNSDFDIDAQYGFRAEEVEEGLRLTGDEDRSRIAVSGTYRKKGAGYVKAAFENKSRKNDQLESEVDFNRYSAGLYLENIEIFKVCTGYTYTKGEYKNTTADFEFTSQQVYLNVNSREYKNFTGGFGLAYFRNKLDLDDESINMTFNGSYRFLGGQRAELIYRVFNFDDFTILDKYYTENIVEFNLIKSFSF